jgi:KaiC/GvpD/RAD55 family RecA-like ATPase
MKSLPIKNAIYLYLIPMNVPMNEINSTFVQGDTEGSSPISHDMAEIKANIEAAIAAIPPEVLATENEKLQGPVSEVPDVSEVPVVPDMSIIKKEIDDTTVGHDDPNSTSTDTRKRKWTKTGIKGFDALLDDGIPKGTSILLRGGPGSGKTIFGLQSLAHAVSAGEKCLYMTFEEVPERLIEHMEDFGWDGKKMMKQGKLMIQQYNPHDVNRQVHAMMEKEEGELLIDMRPLLFPKNFVPDRVVVDSLSSLSAAFAGRQEMYRTYIEQLFRVFGEIGCTSFMISETNGRDNTLSTSGTEDFLADCVIVLYNIRHGDVRESAIECLKLRGASFQKKIVAMQIKKGTGIEVYPDQEVFSEIGE